jgi:hypothetical protein
LSSAPIAIPNTRPMRICQARLSFAFFISLPLLIV